ncbi:MAG: hypothetical protein RIB03_00755 [Henriciella sp.]|uniref:hypothetical protein n=1 Tax=Henriciella sp. TaxID=1968823 RepID=UPI002636BB45|nr:hypothetical protein [Henriciella sp.]
MRGLRHLVSWLLALFLIFMFLQATVHPLPNPPEGMVKLFDRPGENIVFQTMADKTGLYWLEPAGRVAVAIIELLICLLLLIPYSRRFGAVLAFLLLAGAVMAHLSPDILGRDVPVSVGASETDGGRLFALSIAMLASSMLLIFAHPGKRRNPFR